MSLPRFKVVRETYPLSPEFRTDWADLHSRAVGANVFTRLAWLEAGWLHCAPEGDRIRPVRFVDDEGRTRAMCIHLEITVPRPWGRMRIWKTLDINSQRITPFLTETMDDMAAATASLCRAMGRRIDAFDLFKLDPLDHGLMDLKAGLAAAGLECELTRFNIQPRIVMSDNWDAYKKTRSYKTWKQLRRQRRRIDEELAEIRFVRLRRPEDFAELDLAGLFDQIFEVFNNSWQAQATEEAGVLTLEQVRDLYWALTQQAAPEGWLDLNLLYAGERLIAFDLSLAEGRTVYMIIGAFLRDLDRYSPGAVLFMEELIDGHQRGDRILEFGGEYLGYKQKWATENVPAYHLRIQGRTLHARMKTLFLRLKRCWPARLVRGVRRGQLDDLPLPKWLFQHARFQVFSLPMADKVKVKVEGLRFGPLKAADAPVIAICRGMKDRTGRELVPRWAGGSICVGAWSGDKLIGYCFAKSGAYVSLENEDRFSMDLGPDSAYGYDSYIQPDYRGGGLFQLLIHHVQQALGLSGEGRLYATVSVGNQASIKARQKIGGRIVETISYTCLLGATRYTARSEGEICGRFGRYKGRMKFTSRQAR